MKLEFDDYTVEIADGTISIYLGKRRYAVLRAESEVNSVDEKDIDEPLSQPEINQNGDSIDLIWHTKSNLWNRKTYYWHFENNLFWCAVEIEGHGDLDEVHYLDNGKQQSHYDFSRFFTSECTLLDQRYFKSMQYASSDATIGGITHLLQPPSGCRLYIPHPFCCCLGFNDGPWLAAGLAPGKSQYNFSYFNYMSGFNSFCFRLDYDGRTRVNGVWTSPRFVFLPSDSEYTALEKYCDTLRAWGLVEKNNYPRADWWSRPMFCGWGEQHILSIRSDGALPNSDFATQMVYDSFIDIIRKKKLNPGTIVIDDKWQKEYGMHEVDTEKWPDLRKWIDTRHSEDRRVLLWLGIRYPDGLPEDECVKDARGNAVYADPTNPEYQQRIRSIIHRILSPDQDCYNADGIKLDWLFIPSGKGHKLHGDIWGVEFFKSFVKQIYEAAKAVKSDALVITHTANPYFAECTDMIRLNDISDRSREIVSMMTHRQKIAHAACPQALIDCDNSCAPTHTEWIEYMKAQPILGVPSCYFLTAVDGTMEPITDEDWDELSSIWR